MPYKWFWFTLGLALLAAVPASAQTYYPFGAVAIGTTSTVRVGPFGCAVSTSDPTYTTGQIHPCSVTTTGRLRVQALVTDGTDAAQVTATAGGSLQVECTSGCAGTGGTSMVDNAAFTFGTSALTPSGFVFDDVAPNAVTENRVATPRMSGNRVSYQILRDAAGNERGANINASNQLSVSVDNALSVRGQDGAGNALTSSAAGGTRPLDVAIRDAAGALVASSDGGAGTVSSNTTRTIEATSLLKRYISVGTTEDESEVKNAAGVLRSISARNAHATANAFLKCTNALAASTTPGTTAIFYEMLIPANGGFVDTDINAAFSTALTCYIVLSKADTAVDEVGAGDVSYNLRYE